MDERQQPPQPKDEHREPRPLQKDAETDGGGVAQGDIYVPRHPERVPERVEEKK